MDTLTGEEKGVRAEVMSRWLLVSCLSYDTDYSLLPTQLVGDE